MTAETYKTDWRTAAYIQAISRIEMAYLQRGFFHKIFSSTLEAVATSHSGS